MPPLTDFLQLYANSKKVALRKGRATPSNSFRDIQRCLLFCLPIDNRHEGQTLLIGTQYA